MAGQVRIRCPVCGMVAWQNTFNREHQFEILIQERLPGQGRGGQWKWLRNFDPQGMGTRALKLLLVRKMRQVADRLEREAYSLSSTNVEKSASVMLASTWRSTPTVAKYESLSIVTSAEMSYSKP